MTTSTSNRNNENKSKEIKSCKRIPHYQILNLNP